MKQGKVTEVIKDVQLESLVHPEKESNINCQTSESGKANSPAWKQKKKKNQKLPRQLKLEVPAYQTQTGTQSHSLFHRAEVPPITSNMSKVTNSLSFMT